VRAFRLLALAALLAAASPAYAAGHARFVWKRVRGDLFAPIRATDVRQGAIGDCFFDASLAALAEERPEAIRRMVRGGPGGSYVVTLFAHGARKPFTVSALFPEERKRGRLVADHAATSIAGEARPVLWPAVVEKAFAELRGGYGKIMHGGYAGTALTALTGRKVQAFDVARARKRGTTRALWAALVEAGRRRSPTVAATFRKRPEYKGLRLVPSHCYTVLGALTRHGARFVRLRNPWGSYGPKNGGDGANDGIFLLPFDRFCREFEDVDIAKY
jgi:hypothetical protein